MLFVIIWRKRKHPIHEVRGLLIPSEREGYLSFEPLIIIERIKCGQTIFQYFIGIASRWSMDEIQDLSSYILREAWNCMIKFCLGYSDSPNGKLSISLSKPHFCCFRPENWKLQSNVSSCRD